MLQAARTVQAKDIAYISIYVYVNVYMYLNICICAYLAVGNTDLAVGDGPCGRKTDLAVGKTDLAVGKRTLRSEKRTMRSEKRTLRSICWFYSRQ